MFKNCKNKSDKLEYKIGELFFFFFKLAAHKFIQAANPMNPLWPIIGKFKTWRLLSCVRKLTWVGTSLSAGNFTQFRHILVTMSSLKTTISCVQYWIRHGFEVKVEFGSFLLTSSVIEFGMGGLQNRKTLLLKTWL